MARVMLPWWAWLILTSITGFALPITCAICRIWSTRRVKWRRVRLCRSMPFEGRLRRWSTASMQTRHPRCSENLRIRKIGLRNAGQNSERLSPRRERAAPARSTDHSSQTESALLAEIAPIFAAHSAVTREWVEREFTIIYVLTPEKVFVVNLKHHRKLGY